MASQRSSSPLRHPLSTMLLIVMALCVSTVAMAGVGGETESEAAPRQRTLDLLQESLLWIRQHQDDASSQTHVSGSSPASLPVDVATSASAVPISSSAARDQWLGQKFYLRGEDHEAAYADRVRVGFETDRIPGLGQDVSVDYNWSTSQRPGDSTMDLGLAWRIPLGEHEVTFRGRFHENQDEVDSADVRRVRDTRQTLEIDMARNLYSGAHSGLDARVITTDVTRRWYENDDLASEERRSYSLIQLDGYLERYLPALDAYGDLGLTVEGCVGLEGGDGESACGEQLGAFQRYNLSGSLQRQWLNMDWGLHGEYQFTPDELPSWRYMEVGPGMIHGFGGQVMRGREGGWVRLDSETRERLLWSPLKIYTNLRFSFLRGWAESADGLDVTSRASVAEVLWQVSGDSLSGGLRAGTLVESTGPGIAATNVPDVSVNLSWTL